MTQGTSTTSTIARLRDLLARMTRKTAAANFSATSALQADRHHPDEADLPVWSAELVARMDWRRLEQVIAALFNFEDHHAETISGVQDSQSGIGPQTAAATSLVFTRGASPGKTSDGRAVPAQWVGVFTHHGVRRALFLKKATPGHGISSSLDSRELLECIFALPDGRRDALLAMAMQGDWSTPTCPTCNTKMLKLKGGAHYFWGCRNFPKCPHSFDLA
jgi:restriction system protein